MKLSLDVAIPSPTAWVEKVLEHFDTFLQDHADCERKASAMALSMVAKYPDRNEIIPDLIYDYAWMAFSDQKILVVRKSM